MRYNKLKTCSGFTMIEIIIAIGILAILSSMVLANVNFFNSGNGLKLAAQEIVSNIHKVQENTMGLKYASGGTVSVVDGWGIYFDESQPNNYIIFGDINSGPQFVYNNSKKIDSINVDTKYKISSIVLVDSTNTENHTGKTSIDFFSPSLKINICNNTSSCDYVSAKITIQNVSNTSLTKTIVINKFGLVEIQ